MSDVRALGLVGRPVGVGRPAAVALAGCSSSGRLVCGRVGRPVSVGRPVAVALLQLRLLPSSLPRFPRGWCRRSLALALLVVVREAPVVPMHAHERNVK